MPTPGPLELVIILVIALIILGPGKLPDVGASLGKSIREFRKASSDIQEAATVKVDTSPLPPQEVAPVAPVVPVVPVTQVVESAAMAPATPVAATPTNGSAPQSAATVESDAAMAASSASRIEELERELAERRAELARSGEQVGAAAGSQSSGTEAS